MATPSTTQALLTEQEAAQIVALADVLRELETRIVGITYDEASTRDQVRGAARTAEAILTAKDALSNALIVAHVYGHCDAAKAALRNR